MFGTLVIMFPTHHEGGGALFLRQRNHEWIVDPGNSGKALAGGALDRPSVGYVAYTNNIAQDVAPVTSGHCVTLTYNLYFGSSVSERDLTSKIPVLPKPPNQAVFREAFNALLGHPEFMAGGGILAFGLRNRYPIKRMTRLRDILKILDGSDAVVYRDTRGLGFEPTVCMYYYEEDMIIDNLIEFFSAFLDEDGGLDEDGEEESVSIREFLQKEGGIPVRQDDGKIRQNRDIDHDDSDASGDDSDEDEDSEPCEEPEPMEWVTPITAYNRIEGVYATHSSSQIHTIYGDACLIVRIGKAGDRLAYRKVAQIKKGCKKSGFRT
jgi:hypothetical protein